MSDRGGLESSVDEAVLSAWMRAAQDGDSAQYRILLERLSAMATSFTEHSFSRLGLGRGNSAVGDVVQEILLGVHLKRATWDPSQFFLPWFYAIARYKIIDAFRKNGLALRRNLSLEDELETLEATLAAPEAFAGSGQDLERLLSCLPEKQREVLKLVKLEGLSVADAAARTGYSMSDVKVTVHRAIKALREAVEEKSDA